MESKEIEQHVSHTRNASEKFNYHVLLWVILVAKPGDQYTTRHNNYTNPENKHIQM
jgi:hypothetical protein